MFRTISSRIPRDPDYPERTWRIDVLSRLRDGTFYDHLPYSFQEERSGDGEYIPLREHRPAVVYGLPQIIVNDSVGMLFSEGHFPQIRCDDAETRQSLALLADDAGMNRVMIEAAQTGSTGSAAILARFMDGRLYCEVFDTRFLTPVWNPEAPDQLKQVRERYKVRGSDLLAAGYGGLDGGGVYWFGRDWDDQAEIWYQPWPVLKDAAIGPVPVVDTERTVHHHLGFVPWVWIKNLPGGSGPDGLCSFQGAITFGIEIDYQMSQLGRGLRYSSDPTVVLKDPDEMGDVPRGAADPIILGSRGEAKLLEISGNAAAAVLDYVRTCRDMGLESCQGNRSCPDKMVAAQSGRAMELMHHSLILLTDKLRISYGRAYLDLLGLVMRAARTIALKTCSGVDLPLNSAHRLVLSWPKWFPLTSRDHLEMAQSQQMLRVSGLLSQETGVALVSDDYDLPDAAGEVGKIRAESPPPAPISSPSSEG